jgi:branched-subunit amino acid aminotransferase/4-amino-4-deoxychorismate lyase
MPGQPWSKTWTFHEGDWHEGNIPIMGVRDHAAWLCSSVFDGARTFEGVSPDLDLHCARVNASAETMHLKPLVSEETWMGLARDGSKRFAKDAALYIRPMYWAERSGALLVAPDPESTKWCLSLYEAPMRKPEGFSITLSPYRKPSLECMPITRQRVIKLLREAGVSVIETALSYRDVQNADEIFSSGNYSKVMPVIRIDERSLQPGPLYRKARELYWDYAHA